jgi:hypothetical protein
MFLKFQTVSFFFSYWTKKGINSIIEHNNNRTHQFSPNPGTNNVEATAEDLLGHLVKPLLVSILETINDVISLNIVFGRRPLSNKNLELLQSEEFIFLLSERSLVQLDSSRWDLFCVPGDWSLVPLVSLVLDLWSVSSF